MYELELYTLTAWLLSESVWYVDCICFVIAGVSRLENFGICLNLPGKLHLQLECFAKVLNFKVVINKIKC